MSEEFAKKLSFTKRVYSDRVNLATVEVVRSECTPSPFLCLGPYRWCLYAYIFPNSSLFEVLLAKGDDYYKYPSRVHEQFHGGLTYTRFDYDGLRNVEAIKIGCDYNHLGDEQHTYEPDEGTYLDDAEKVVRWLELEGR